MCIAARLGIVALTSRPANLPFAIIGGSEMMITHLHQRPRRRGVATLRRLIATFGFWLTASSSTSAIDFGERTVVTIARDGSWGVATSGSQGQAIAEAIRDCRAMAAGPSDCGAQITTTRGDW